MKLKEYSSTAFYTFDPIPPKNSIRSYQREERRTNRQQDNARQESFLASLFQSLMPSYNVLDQQRQANNANNNNNQDDNQNEAANRPAMNQFLTRLREFLSTVELHFPAEPNLNNNNNNGNNNPNDDPDQDNDEVEYD